MATNGPARQDLEPPLTRSLRQVLIGTATAFVLGGAAPVVGMQSLDEKVQGWHRMEVADTKRESLLDVADQFSRDPTVVKSEIILTASSASQRQSDGPVKTRSSDVVVVQGDRLAGRAPCPALVHTGHRILMLHCRESREK